METNEEKKGMLLDRKALLAKEKLGTEKVVFDDGSYVFVRQMTGRERDLFEQSLVKKTKDSKGVVTGFEQNTEDFRAKLAVLTLCDEEGNALLQPTDYNMLSVNMSAFRLETIIKVAQRINKMSEEEKDASLKNSDAVQDGNSSSDSVKS